MQAVRLVQPEAKIDTAPSQPRPPRRTRRRGLLAPDLVHQALKQSFIMLRPDIQWANPVMFVVEVGALLTLLFVLKALVADSASQVPVTYFIALDAWLFLTVLFANFATALAEARGKAQAESLRRTRRDTPDYRLRLNNTIEEVSSALLKLGDRVVVEAGQTIPGDGEASPRFSTAARAFSTKSRIAVCPVFMSTSPCWMAWKPAIGWPNCRRCCANSTDRSTIADARPRAIAATTRRS